MKKTLLWCCFFRLVCADDSYISRELRVPCHDEYIPENCGYPNITLENIITVEDFDRCGPALLSTIVRNFFWGGAGRKITYQRNLESFKRLCIIPRMLRDVSKNTLLISVLNTKIQFPVGISPVAALALAHPTGEIAAAKAAASMGTIMIVSSFSHTSLEDVSEAAFSVNPDAVLWMQTYIFTNRDEVLSIIKRAERAKFKALVVTVDSPVDASGSCNARDLSLDIRLPNLFNETYELSNTDASLTFKDLAWLIRKTRLPVIAKGLFTEEDAIIAAAVGVSGILVSNHGGRQLDSQRSTIETLPEVVRALRLWFPNVEVYMDGGVRNGWDVFKVLASGAKAAFVGRPVVWGLGIGGEEGVRKMLTILKTEFNETMLVAGYSNPDDVSHEGRIHIDELESVPLY